MRRPIIGEVGTGQASIADLEARQTRIGGCIDGVEAGHFREGRPVASPIEDALHEVGVALQQKFDGSVRSVTDPSGQPQHCGLAPQRCAIGDALDATAY